MKKQHDEHWLSHDNFRDQFTADYLTGSAPDAVIGVTAQPQIAVVEVAPVTPARTFIGRGVNPITQFPKPRRGKKHAA